ncbi:hypothetical protein J3R30DRAFT_1220974 [Lentinula aciculospora]|uniref:Uncharacterized protein n=1 Tax=Lentinula aciculospora TaxID=153920 RepID=A0A9W9DI89_9AGAR|nr:hypothetical protein J3R30DRAFT_1220974 [Lentinula aciculospora]
MFILAISRFVYAMSTAMIGITIFAVRFLQHTFSHSIGDDPAVCLSQPTSMADGRFSKLAFSDSTQRSLHIFHYLTTSVFFMTFLLRSLQLYAASLLFCHLAGAFLLTPPNVVSCFLQHVIWNREAGDPQAIQLLLQDIAQGGLRNIVQSLDPTAEEGTVSVSFSHPGDYEIQCEDNNGTLISSLPLTVPDCTMPGSTSAKTSALESSANIASATGTARSLESYLSNWNLNQFEFICLVPRAYVIAIIIKAPFNKHFTAMAVIFPECILKAYELLT